ncbi:MAG: type II toxin-antitoxin system VapC family toxin [Candidatus Dormibacteraceae bacterium]
MTYLLDTNVCIDLLRGQSTQIRMRFKEISLGNYLIAISIVVLFELWYGVAKSTRQQENTQRLGILLAGPIEILSLTPEDVQMAGQIRAELEAKGNSIGAYDVLIAGQALQQQAILVTANTSEFTRVQGLKLEDWTN